MYSKENKIGKSTLNKTVNTSDITNTKIIQSYGVNYFFNENKHTFKITRTINSIILKNYHTHYLLTSHKETYFDELVNPNKYYKMY